VSALAHAAGRAVIGLCLAACASPFVGRPRCPRALDGTFVQLSGGQIAYESASWERVLQTIGTHTGGEIILQFTGDAQGSFEARDGPRRVVPIEALLAAADGARMRVHLGLHLDARWPHTADLDALPLPLGDDASARALGALCERHRSCVGWYLSPEFDDMTHGDPSVEPRVTAWLTRASAKLRSLASPRPVSVSTYRGGRFGPDGFAAFWGRVLPGTGIDVLMFQDGGGTGRGDPETTAAYLRALRPVLDRTNVRLWAVIELFEQVHGPPVDAQPFAAVAGSYPSVRARIDVARLYADRLVAFSLLDYAVPARGRSAAQLGLELSYACAPRGPL